MTASPETFYQWGAWFAVQNQAAWLSHHDTCRHWSRALRRSGLQLHYSEGFNPHPKMSLPAPRSVGQASCQELALFETQIAYEAPDLRLRLEQQLPENITLLNCERFFPRVKVYPAAIAYRLRLAETLPMANLADNIARFSAAAEWTILRAAHGRHARRHINIRPGVSRLRLDGRNLFCTFIFEAAGTCRIDELLAALDIPQNGVEELLREQVSYRVMQSGQSREAADTAALLALAQASA